MDTDGVDLCWPIRAPDIVHLSALGASHIINENISLLNSVLNYSYNDILDNLAARQGKEVGVALRVNKWHV